MDKLRLILIGVVVALVALIIVSITILVALGRDTEQVTTFALIVIPIVITAAGLGTIQLQQTQKLDNVAKNVNGNTTRLLDALDYYRSRDEQAATLGQLTPSDPPISEDTVLRIKSDRDKLPKHEWFGENGPKSPTA